MYYAPLLVHRAGLSTRDEYLAELSSEIRTLQTTPGRLEQSVEQASHDTWIKFYRPNENSRNTTVSYYTKGAVLGFLLDTKVRRLTGGGRSLDDVMRLAFDRYAGARGFTPDEFRTTVLEVVGDDGELRSWLRTVLETTTELDYGEALDWYGMNLSRPGGSTEDDDTPPGWLGLGIRSDGANVVVSRVVRATPGAEAGFNVDDEIVAIDGYRVRAADWTDRLALYEAGASASVLVARRGRLLTLETTFGRAPQDEWDLALREVQTQTQPYRVDAWLGAAR